LAVLLTYNNAKVRKAAVLALHQFRTEARPAARQLTTALIDALVKVDEESAMPLADTLSAIFTAAPDLQDECFAPLNPEVRKLAQAALRESARRELQDVESREGHDSL
jgi:hypothetical protein